MVRRRWPDVVIVVAIVALTVVGVWAIWGEQITGESHPKPKIQAVPGGGSVS